MKLYIFPTGRAFAVTALKNYLGLDCEILPIDLGRGDRLTPQYLALNPNKKIYTRRRWLRALGVECHLALPDGQASRTRRRAVRFEQEANVLRWLAWQSAHWDAECCGMVAYEKGSKTVLGLGPPDPGNRKPRHRESCREGRQGRKRALQVRPAKTLEPGPGSPPAYFKHPSSVPRWLTI
jgi:glutathione S-transferase